MAVEDDDDGFRTTPAPRRNPLLAFARDNLALLVPVIAALIFAFRCLIVSEGDLYVASILVSTTSIGDAIRALLFTVVPALILILAFFLGVVVARRIAKGSWRDLWTVG